MVISLFETVKIRLFISHRNLYNSLESIEEKPIFNVDGQLTLWLDLSEILTHHDPRYYACPCYLQALKKNLVNSNQEKMETSS